MLFFVLETVAVIIAFQIKAVTHLGYIMDVSNISLIQIVIENLTLIKFNYQMAVTALQFMYLSKYGSYVKILNVFRFWRLVRLLNSMVVAEQEAHGETLLMLDSRDKRCLKLEEDVMRLEDDIKKEHVSTVLSKHGNNAYQPQQ